MSLRKVKSTAISEPGGGKGITAAPVRVPRPIFVLAGHYLVKAGTKGLAKKVRECCFRTGDDFERLQHLAVPGLLVHEH